MGRYQVIEKKRGNLLSIVLIDEETRCEAEILPSVGNNLFRLQIDNESLMMYPSEIEQFEISRHACYQYVIPVLFPPNRIFNGKMEFRGNDYHFPINEEPHHLHGDLCHKEWEVVEMGAYEEEGAFVTSVFDLEKHPDLLYFPHQYIFTLTYRLKNGQLLIEGKVINEDTHEAPFFLGFHPYFSYPLLEEQNMELIIPAIEEWPIDSLAFVTEGPQASLICQQLQNGLKVSDVPSMGGWLVKLDTGNRLCKINFLTRRLQVVYELDPNFPFLLLFKPNWGTGISLEPYTCVTDAFNLPFAPELTGLRSLKPKEIFSCKFSISMDRILD